MARAAKRSRRLSDTYWFPGFRPEPTVRGIFGDPKALVIGLKRRSKNGVRLLRSRPDGLVRPQGAPCARSSCGDKRIFLELEVRRIDCRRCGKVKRERLDFLADNPLYTKRFAFYVGRRCRAETIKDVAVELALDWHTVKALDMQYMEAQLKRAGTPGPQVIGVDEISIRKGHTYRIVVSDLLRGRPIWFGGEDRSAASMSQFYAWLGQKKSSRIRLAVMDMWKPFDWRRMSMRRKRRFCSTSSTSSAIWARPWMRFARVSMPGSRAASALHQGSEIYVAVAQREPHARRQEGAEDIVGGHKRLNTAYVLKESFGQLWSYEREGWARRYFENWRASLKWQRLKPYEKFAEMINRHWDGIAAYCRLENKVSLGFVEGSTTRSA